MDPGHSGIQRRQKIAAKIPYDSPRSRTGFSLPDASLASYGEQVGASATSRSNSSSGGRVYYTERRGWKRGGAVGAGPGMSGGNENVRNWKLNFNFEGSGVSIRSERKEPLNAVALARNMYLLDKNKKTIDKATYDSSRNRTGIRPAWYRISLCTESRCRPSATSRFSASALMNRDWGCMYAWIVTTLFVVNVYGRHFLSSL
jgi:hypothetical protein